MKRNSEDTKPESLLREIFHFRMMRIVLAISLMLLITMALYAKSYRMDSIDIDAGILTDGGLQVTETRTYSFSGDFSWADYRLPLKNLGSIENFELREGDSHYREANDGSPGTYTISLGKDEMYVKWFYDAHSGTRSFTLLYKVNDAVIVYDDIAEFYYKFVGKENEKKIGRVNVTINLPHPAVFGEVRAWAHGPHWGKILFKDGVLRMDVSPLHPNAFWEARVVFPPSWIPDARRKKNMNMLPIILKEEERLASESNAERERAKMALAKKEQDERRGAHIVVILSLVGIFGVTIFYFRFGRRNPVSYNLDVDSAIPEYPPAIFSGLYSNKTITGNALVATLFDLARRGFITIEQKEPVEKKWWRIDRTLFMMRPDRNKWMSSLNELTSYERSILDFIFNVLGEGKESVDFLDFRKHPMKVHSWFREWQTLLNDELKRIPLYDRDGIRGTLYSIALSVLISIGGIIVTAKIGSPGPFAIIAGILFAFISFFILHYTPEMALQKRKWKAFRNYLKRYYFQSEGDQSFLYRIPDFLIYGMAMGVGTKSIEKLMEIVPQDQRTTFFPWYIYAPGSHVSAAEFAGAVSSMVSVASSTMSSTTGAGGGASAGGGGGAGGASGGAG